MTALCLVYMTASDIDEARRIGRALVGARLAACVNIVDGMRSIYWWQGDVIEDGEAVVIAKTRQALVGPLTKKVKALHSYSCPCVVALPISAGNADFLRWLDAETQPTAS